MVALVFVWENLRIYSFPAIAIEAGRTVAEFDGAGLLKTLYAVAGIVALACALLMPRFATGALASRRVLAPLGVMEIAAACGALARVEAGAAASDPLLAVCIVLVGASTACLTVRLASDALALGGTGAALVLGASFVLSSLLDGLTNASYATRVMLFVASSACAVIYLAAFPGSSGEKPAADRASLRFPTDALRGLPWGCLAIEGLLACFSSMIISALIGMRIGPMTLFVRASLVNAAVSTALGALLGAVCLAALARRQARTGPLALLLVTLGMFCGVALAVYLVPGVRYISLALDHAAMLALWLTLACTMHAGGDPSRSAASRSATPRAALVCLLVACAQCFVASDYIFNVGLFSNLVERTSIGEVLVVSILGGAVVCALGFAWRLLMRSRTPDELANDALKEPLERAFAGAHLTARECEIAALLYRGLSVPRIAESTSLSEATVKSHAAHIYRKLGIHSKQELIAYVDGFRSA